jgi:3-isopropylmalate/(R)-2-methylmalate dehydratase large subunit
MEGRMTVCNMSIEAGAKAGLIAPDEVTFAYLEGRARAPRGADWEAAVADWRTLVTDEGATFDKEVVIDASGLTPHVSWGTNPGQVAPIGASVPDPEAMTDPAAREAAERALVYMGLRAGTPLREVPVDTVFIGSCTNSRIEDLRAAAAVARGRSVKAGMRAMVVPGSFAVKDQAVAEGSTRCSPPPASSGGSRVLDVPGHEPRQAEPPGERSASTSNRNFEGPPGRGGPHPPRLPRGRRRHRHRRHLRRPPTCPPEETRVEPITSSPAPPSRSTAATSTPTRSSPPSG